MHRVEIKHDIPPVLELLHITLCFFQSVVHFGGDFHGESGKTTIGEIFSIGEILIRDLYRQLFPPFFKTEFLLRQLFPPIPKSTISTYPAFSPMAKNGYLGSFFHQFKKVLFLLRLLFPLSLNLGSTLQGRSGHGIHCL